MKQGKARIEPVLVVDTREQMPLEFVHLKAERGTLQTGDYSVKGLEDVFAVERKSLADLAGSLTRERERFMRELHRLRGFPFPYLLVIGNDMELSGLVAKGRANLKQIENSLQSIRARYRVHVVRADNAVKAARLVETWAFCAWREMLKPAGVSMPFPDWAVGVLCPRYNQPITAEQVISDIERGLV